MKKSSKLIALIMAMALATTAFTGCSSNNEESSKESSSSQSGSESSKDESSSDGIELVGNTYVSGLPIAKEPIVYTIMNKRSTHDLSGSQNEKEICIFGETDTNVKIDWTETADTAFAEQLGLILAAGGDGMPDATFDAFLTTAQVSTNVGRFFEITDETLRTFAPNIVSLMEENLDDGIDSLRQADGKIYSLINGAWATNTNDAKGVTFINKTWVENVGKEIPTTMDELYDVLVAIKEGDPNGNGTNDEIPYIFAQNNWCSKIQELAGYYGIAGRNLNSDQWFGRVDDGVYTTNIDSQNFKDFLTEMNEWYNAGLLNIDGFSMTGAEFSSLQSQNLHAMITGWTPPVDDGCEWEVLPVIEVEGYEGQAVKTGELNTCEADINGFFITTACEEPEGLLRWWDHLHSTPETRRLSRDGNDGGVYKNNEDGTATIITDVVLPDGFSNSTQLVWSTGWRGGCLMFGDDLPKPAADDTESEDAKRLGYNEILKDYFMKEFIPITPVPGNVADDFTLTKTEVENVVTTFMATAITTGMTDEKWDIYLSDLNASGLAEWQKYYQNYVDKSWD